jgi:hypothetical protein
VRPLPTVVPDQMGGKGMATDTRVAGGRPMDNLISLAAFGIFAILWVAFAVGVVASQGSLDATWEWIRGLPIIIQAVVWLLFLPVVAGLWVWETGWPLVARLVLVGGLAVATLYVFAPRWFLEGRS